LKAAYLQFRVEYFNISDVVKGPINLTNSIFFINLNILDFTRMHITQKINLTIRNGYYLVDLQHVLRIIYLVYKTNSKSFRDDFRQLLVSKLQQFYLSSVIFRFVNDVTAFCVLTAYVQKKTSECKHWLVILWATKIL
jgi:hypothetical protein